RKRRGRRGEASPCGPRFYCFCQSECYVEDSGGKAGQSRRFLECGSFLRAHSFHSAAWSAKPRPAKRPSSHAPYKRYSQRPWIVHRRKHDRRVAQPNFQSHERKASPARRSPRPSVEQIPTFLLWEGEFPSPYATSSFRSSSPPRSQRGRPASEKPPPLQFCAESRPRL